MEKIKISFDYLDIWDQDDFRKLIYQLNVIDSEDFDVYIITKDPNITYSETVASSSQIPNDKVFNEITNNDVLTRINQLKIDIHLVYSKELIDLINANSSCRAILVSSLYDRYRILPQYIVSLQFWIDLIINKRNNFEKKC